MKNLYFNKYCLILVPLLLFQIRSGFAQINISSGTVSGTWSKANSPYHINGEITIPDGENLTIEPRVEVVFMGHYKFNVQGRLLAVGTKKDTIRFTAEDKNTGWHGVRFINTPNSNDTSKLVYCSFKYGKANTGSSLDRCGGAILISTFDKVLVSNCLFNSNMQSGDGWNPPEGGPAIYIYYASPIIKNSTFSNNTGSKSSAVACVTCPNAIISNNIFLNNSGAFGAIVYASNSNGIISDNIISNNVATLGGGGIFIDCALVSGSTNPRVENNIVIHNQAPSGGGIACYINSNPILINNTIAYNNATSGAGIYFDGNSDAVLINNILFGNESGSGSQVFINDASSDPIFKYCDIQGGKEGFAGAGAGTKYIGLYENNIDVDPSFSNVASNNYSLSNASHCIGAGIDSIEINGTMFHCPTLCIMGNPRPSPVGSKPDIGASENLLASPLVGVEESTTPNEFALYQNYPNPFNPTTTIQYFIPKETFVTILVYNVLGKEITTLVNERKAAGNYSINFNAINLPSSVYFYRMQAGSFVSTKKLVLLK